MSGPGEGMHSTDFLDLLTAFGMIGHVSYWATCRG